jgi:hypothetical protein
LLLRTNDPRRQEAYWLGADLVVEIISVDNPERDTVEKVADYAEAHIPEYWIVNPLDETITVLVLAGDAYTTYGVFWRGEQAASHQRVPADVRYDKAQATAVECGGLSRRRRADSERARAGLAHDRAPSDHPVQCHNDVRADHRDYQGGEVEAGGEVDAK